MTVVLRMLRPLLGVLVLGIAMLAMAGPSQAMLIDAPLPDPAAEARAVEISKGLRCLVCQNQSIEDSNADLARDLRRIVRERIVAGDDDEQVRAWLVARYGDWVLLKPPFKTRTLVLWIAPGVLLVLAGLVAWTFYRRRGQVEAPAPLSADERARVEKLMAVPGQPGRAEP